MKRACFVLLITTIFMAGCNNDPKTAAARYSGSNISTNAEILKDTKSKKTTLHMNADTSWQLYAGPSDKEINFSQPVASGETGGIFDVNVPFAPRQYFQLITTDGKAIFAERHLPMEKGFNYRDMGGYRTADGHYVKWGLVFRTDDMHNLTQADMEYLAALPLKTIVDFRSSQEIGEAPDRIPASVTNHAELSISPGNLTDISQVDITDGAKMEDYMMDINKSFSTDPQIMAQYREFFRLLQDEDSIPLSFHCTAGKDRTGMGAALFLFSLGASEEVIMQDYLLSNKYLVDKYGKYMEEYPALKPMFTVDAKYLQAGLDQIKSGFGSIENFLKNELNVDIAKMKKIYLYR